IWSRPQYVWIHFDNIGSWSTGNFIIGTRKTADHVIYTFLIPVFVVGEWDVKMPTGLVEFKPEKPFVAKGFGLADLIPSLGLGKIGKFLVIGLIGFILLFLLGGIFPPVMTIFKSILNRIVSIFKPKIS
ncbi:MAG: hypothetical protein GY950_22975, partial [bacterium]|nr:hypothetical protein [bacterium]